MLVAERLLRRRSDARSGLYPARNTALTGVVKRLATIGIPSLRPSTGNKSQGPTPPRAGTHSKDGTGQCSGWR